MHTCSTHEQIFTTSLQSTEIIDGIDSLFHKFSRNYHVEKRKTNKSILLDFSFFYRIFIGQSVLIEI